MKKRKNKNKNSFIVIIVLLCLSLLVYFLLPKPNCSLSSLEKRAVWLTYQDLSELSYESEKDFQDGFQNMIKKIKEYQCNTMIVHVRPFSDALYFSEVYPMSQVVAHRNSVPFDPLQVMVKMAHKEGLNIEAWINPYRISLNEKTYNQFVQNSKYEKWLGDSQTTIHYGEYQYIFNPASQKVRDLIVDGVEEIVRNYDIDGIHFDDYFYIPKTHGDTTVEERQENVNLLIQDVYQSIKTIRKDVAFGISPQGNYENCIDDGADIDLWLKEEGFIDYLMPQIYWSNQYGKDGNTKMFSERTEKFAKLKRHKNIKLYVGLALYQAGQSLEYDQGWKNSIDNISEQVQILYNYGYDGYSLFRYGSLIKEEGQKEMDELLRNHPN